MSKKIVSFSLWGDIPMYNVGAIRNAELMFETYPFDWTARFYIGSDVPKKTINTLNAFPNVEIVDMTGTPNDWQGMFWRFYGVNKEEDIEYIVFRDTDSRITPREWEATREWMNSGKCLHIMRDHPYHTEPIMGGMWGCKPKELIDIINRDVYEKHNLEHATNLQKVVENWMLVEWGRTERHEEKAMSVENYHTKGIDQRFLRAVIYPLALKEAHIQDAYPMYNAWSGRFDYYRGGHEKEFNTGFPSMRGRDWDNFIGQVYDEHDKPNEEYAKLIKDRDELVYTGWGDS